MRKDDVLKKLPKGFSEWKAEDYLKDDESIKNLIKFTLEDHSDNPRFILKVLAVAAKAKKANIAAMARKTDLTRIGIRNALKENGNPTLETLSKIAGELGYRLTLEPLPEQNQQAAE